MAVTRFVSRGLLDHLFKSAAFAQPTNIEVALLDSTGTELTGENYARVVHNTWNAATNADPAEVSNEGAVQFPAPGTGGWGTASRFAIFDDEAEPNMLVEEDLDIAKEINEGDDVSFPAGDLKIRFGPLTSFA